MFIRGSVFHWLSSSKVDWQEKIPAGILVTVHVRPFEKTVDYSDGRLSLIEWSATSGFLSETFLRFICLHVLVLFPRNSSAICQYFPFSVSVFLQAMVPLSEKYLYSIAMRTLDIHCRLCTLFMEDFRRNELKSVFFSSSLNFADFLRWLLTISIAAAIEIRPTVEQKSRSRPKGAVYDSLFGAVDKGVLHELGTQQVF